MKPNDTIVEELKSKFDENDIYDPDYLFGSQDFYWIAWARFAQYIGEKFPKEVEDKLNILVDIATQCEWWWPFEEICFVSEKPTELHFDDAGALHNPTGPAIKYADGFSIFLHHGRYFDEDRAYIITHPEQITVVGIEKEQNAEIRRIMIEHYGYERYIKDGQFEVLDEDTDSLGNPRRLLRRQFEDDTILLVAVKNSTKEPDGTYKDYILSVHPECRPMHEDGTLGKKQRLSCAAAVASTFGMTKKDYQIEFES